MRGAIRDEDVFCLQGQVMALEKAVSVCLVTIVGMSTPHRSNVISSLSNALEQLNAGSLAPGERIENPSFTLGFERTLTLLRQVLRELSVD